MLLEEEKLAEQRQRYYNTGSIRSWLLYPAITLLAMSKGEITANLYEF